MLLEIFAEPFSGFFGLSGETKGLCIGAMRVISICFVFAGVNIAFQGIFQALDGGTESLAVSVCRQLLFVFPFAILFADMVKADIDLSWLMWAVFPIAEVLTAAVAVLLFVMSYRKIEAKLSDV